ncbi:MAG: VWA domain-containing protein [Pseudomonadota bacterium]
MVNPAGRAPGIVDNILRFGRLLRAAGLQIASSQIIDAVNAVTVTDIAEKSSFYWALRTAFVKRRTEQEIFDQAFAVFWRDPAFLKRMLTLTLPPTTAPPQPDQKKNLARRLADVLDMQAAHAAKPKSVELQIEAFESFSSNVMIRKKDFAQMSTAELRQAKTEVLHIRIVREKIRTRRYQPSLRGSKIDLRAALRNTALRGPDYLLLFRKEHRLKPPPLVVLCDISGSMDQYARILLHFLYALQDNRKRVSCFLFATRLHNVTKTLQNRDPDAAITSVGANITDWSGGTRIGQCLNDFNQHWARRVLGHNAQVLLFTDGLDRDAGNGMERSVRRLRASCRKLIWVNPLLRYDKYQPIASGARILDRYAHAIRSCHNVESLADLAAALNSGAT